MFDFNIHRVMKVRADFWVIIWNDRFYACGIDLREHRWHCQCEEGTHGAS